MAHYHTFGEQKTGQNISIGRGMHIHKLNGKDTDPAPNDEKHTHYLNGQISGEPIEDKTNIEFAKKLGNRKS